MKSEDLKKVLDLGIAIKSSILVVNYVSWRQDGDERYAENKVKLKLYWLGCLEERDACSNKLHHNRTSRTKENPYWMTETRRKRRLRLNKLAGRGGA